MGRFRSSALGVGVLAAGGNPGRLRGEVAEIILLGAPVLPPADPINLFFIPEIIALCKQ